MEKGLTNQKLISELLPLLKERIKTIPPLIDKDYYNHPCYYTRDEQGRAIRYTSYGKEDIIVEVTKSLEGRYSTATCSALLKKGNIKGYFFAKELKGLGNGFYAMLNEKGKIIKSEWD
ncbi:MAG: hypothetical protein NC833_03150 [Candidatus Omnitrophica bacterium]|nr:hypothetical protein [Candidatus Omnitrophota bacterium]